MPYPRRVLVVDDAKATRELFNHLLNRRGIQASFTEDGLEAWVLLQQKPFDVVITDVEMPRWSGIDLVRAMRESLYQRIRTTPVIVSSSIKSPRVLNTVRSYQATYLLSKPVTATRLDVLLRMIATVRRRGGWSVRH